MKAIRVHAFGGPEALKLEEVPDPSPGAGEVVVKVHAAGVNPVETYIRAGRYGHRKFPFTPGNDAAGVIESVGPGVARWKAGDRVYASACLTGAYAERTLCDEGRVHPLPAHVTFAQGAGIGIPYGTAYRALFTRGGARAGETLLIHGASGGVGIAATQLARKAGLTILGTAGSPRGLQLVREQGAQHAVDHTAHGYVRDLLGHTEGRGFDLILEMLANVNLGKDLGMLAKNGRVVVVGSRGTVEIDARDTMARDADIRGMSLANASEGEIREIHEKLVAGLEDRSLNPVVGEEIPLSEAPRAHEAVIEDKSYGKIVLVT